MQARTFARLAVKVVRRTVAETLYIKAGINLSKPSDVRATLTERCNYRCRYCNHWRQPSYTDEMSFEQWQRALLSVRDFCGRFAVQFLGGEPMLVPWFLDLAEFCRDHRIDWGVITNGSSLSADRVKRLVGAHPLNLDVSIDSLAAHEHDWLRGVQGSMERVRVGVERLVEERARQRKQFSIRLKPTVTRQTIGSLGSIVDWAESMPGVTVDFSPVRLWRPEDVAEMYPSRDDERALLDREIGKLVQRRHTGAPIETSDAKLAAMRPLFMQRPATHGVASCRVGLRSIDIRPNGDVDHCFKFRKIGNLRESTMSAIWRDMARRETIDRTLDCTLFASTCSTSCRSHRTALQDAARGIRALRARV